MSACTIATIRADVFSALATASGDARVHESDPFTTYDADDLRDRIMRAELVRCWYIQHITPRTEALPGQGALRRAQVEIVGLYSIVDLDSYVDVQDATSKVVDQLSLLAHAERVASAGYSVRTVLDGIACHRSQVLAEFFALSPLEV